MEKLGETLSRLRIREALLALPADPTPPPPEPQPACPRCRDAGFLRMDVPIGHSDFGKLVPCSCRGDELVRKRRDKLERLSNLGPLVRMTFESLLPDGRSSDPGKQVALPASAGARARVRREARRLAGARRTVGGGQDLAWRRASRTRGSPKGSRLSSAPSRTCSTTFGPRSARRAKSPTTSCSRRFATVPYWSWTTSACNRERPGRRRSCSRS